MVNLTSGSFVVVDENCAAVQVINWHIVLFSAFDVAVLPALFCIIYDNLVKNSKKNNDL